MGDCIGQTSCLIICFSCWNVSGAFVSCLSWSVDILSVCYLSSMDSQLRSQRLRWFGHVSRMQDSELPKVMMFGQVKGPRCVGRPSKSWINKELCHTHLHCWNVHLSWILLWLTMQCKNKKSVFSARQSRRTWRRRHRCWSEPCWPQQQTSWRRCPQALEGGARCRCYTAWGCPSEWSYPPPHWAQRSGTAAACLPGLPSLGKRLAVLVP